MDKTSMTPGKVFDFVDRLIGYYILGVILVFMCLFITAEILVRLGVNYSFMGLVDIVDQCVLFLTYLCLGVVQRERMHVTVDMLPNRLKSRRSGPVLDCVILGLGIMLSSFLLWETAWYLIHTYQANSQTMTLFLPKWPFVAAMPLGMLLFLVRQIIQFKESLNRALHFGGGSIVLRDKAVR